MTKRNSTELDDAVLREMDADWVEGPPELQPSEEDFNRLLGFFSPVRDDLRTDLLHALKRTRRSLVTDIVNERARDPRRKTGPSPKPSTAIARDLKALGDAARGLDDRLIGLDPATSALLAENLDWVSFGSDPSKQGWQPFLEHLYWSLDTLESAATLGDGVAQKGQNQAALKIMVRALAGWWEANSGSLPVTDKGRRQRQEPFLELCRDMLSLAEKELRHRGVTPGSRQLDGIVQTVLADMKAKRGPEGEPREK